VGPGTLRGRGVISSAGAAKADAARASTATSVPTTISLSYHHRGPARPSPRTFGGFGSPIGFLGTPGDPVLTFRPGGASPHDRKEIPSCGFATCSLPWPRLPCRPPWSSL